MKRKGTLVYQFVVLLLLIRDVHLKPRTSFLRAVYYLSLSLFLLVTTFNSSESILTTTQRAVPQGTLARRVLRCAHYHAGTVGAVFFRNSVDLSGFFSITADNFLIIGFSYLCMCSRVE